MGQIAFSSEEGLLSSLYLCTYPAIPYYKTTYCLHSSLETLPSYFPGEKATQGASASVPSTTALSQNLGPRIFLVVSNCIASFVKLQQQLEFSSHHGKFLLGREEISCVTSQVVYFVQCTPFVHKHGPISNVLLSAGGRGNDAFDVARLELCSG